MAVTNIPSAAASLYAKTWTIGQGQSAMPNDGVSFSDFLKEKITESINTVKGGEKASALAVAGKADLIDVVQATNAAEITLQSVVAVRDRMISAYQEVERMQI